MYSRNFRPAQQRTEGNIPVQYFDESFSADAFNAKKAGESPNDQEKSIQNVESSNDKTNAPTNTARKLDIEDLVLMGLIMLFASDIKEKDDLLIPVILASILLF